MDRGSTASTSLSPRLIGSTTTSYARDVARVVQPGAVAKRITQLQAALFHQDPTPSSSNPSLRRITQPALKTRVGRDCLRSPLSPSSIPLPQTPFSKSYDSEPSWQHDVYCSGSTVKATDGNHHGISQNKQSEGAKDIFDYHPEVNDMEANKLHQQQETHNLNASDDSTIIPGQYASRDNLFRPLRPKASILSPLFVAQLQDSPTRLRSSPEPAGRSPSPSPGGAYSKISPFTADTSFPSYIPTRQSPKDSAGVGPSLRKFRSMLFNGQERLSPRSASPQTPRSRDARSLRRRMFSIIPDVNGKSRTKVESGRQSATSSSTGSLEDVFRDPIRMVNNYHVESALVADDDQPLNSGTSRNKQPSGCISSKTPKFNDPQYTWTEPHTQPVSFAKAELDKEMGLLHSNPDSDSRVMVDTTDSISHRSSGPSGKAGRNGLDNFLNNRYPYPSDYQTNLDGDVFSDNPRSVSEGSQCLTDHHDLAEELSLKGEPAIPAYDGTHYAIKSRNQLRQGPGSSRISFSSRHISNTRAFRSPSSTNSANDLSGDILRSVHSLANQINQGNGLRLIITVDRSVEKAVRIEVHPLVDICPSAGERDDRNVVVG